MLTAPKLKVTPYVQRPVEERRIENLVATAFFAIVLILTSCTVLYAFSKNSSSVTKEEARQMHAFPRLRSLKRDLPSFASNFELCLADHFPPKMPLVAARNFLLLKFLNSSGHPDVGVGKNDWLFYFPITVLQCQINYPRFSDTNLNLWLKAFAAKERFLDQQHIKYLVFIPPEKATIYPEFFTPNLEIRPGKSRLSALQEKLRNINGIDFIDVRALLERQKQQRFALYKKLDAHWNDFAAILTAKAVSAVLKRNFPAVPLISDADYDLATKDSYDGDLASALGLQSVLHENVPVFQLKSPKFRMLAAEQTPFATRYKMGSCAFINEDKSLPSIFVIHDSYVRYHMTPMIAQLSRFVEFHWTQEFEPELVLKQKPDIFIEEFAERHLFDTVPPNIPDMVRMMNKPSHVYATVGDAAGHPAVASFNDKIELVDIATEKERDGLKLTLLWRALERQALNKSVHVYLDDEAGVEQGKRAYAQDLFKREVQAGQYWVDTIGLEQKDVIKGKKLSIGLVSPTTGLIPVQAKNTEWNALRVCFPMQFLADNMGAFRRGYAVSDLK